MNPPRPSTKCRRCRFAFAAHVVLGRQALPHCPDGSGRVFLRHTPSRGVVLRFDRSELTTLEKVLNNAAHAGGSARELVALLRKVRGALSQRALRACAQREAEAKAS
jgi:hypothetical protein